MVIIISIILSLLAQFGMALLLLGPLERKNTAHVAVCVRGHTRIGASLSVCVVLARKVECLV